MIRSWTTYNYYNVMEEGPKDQLIFQAAEKNVEGKNPNQASNLINFGSVTSESIVLTPKWTSHVT